MAARMRNSFTHVVQTRPSACSSSTTLLYDPSMNLSHSLLLSTRPFFLRICKKKLSLNLCVIPKISHCSFGSVFGSLKSILLRGSLRINSNLFPKLPSILAPFSVFVLKGLKSPQVVQCKQPRLARADLFGPPKGGSNVKFDWNEFWKILRPDLVILLLAAAFAIVGALLNIQLPIALGSLINTVSSLELGQLPGDYMNRLVDPGLRLLGIYCLQSACAFGYISLLSIVGERCAVRLRTNLFQSLIEQDIAFFDEHRTGELINRLSADVQDFKSAFKQVISQGLRGVTQTAGCIVSLYILSPQMTAVVGILVPCIIGVGTTLGRLLRKWSRQSQEQGAKATAVADEAVSNIRTVRAFAMEEKELSLYQAELEESSYLNQRLGLGIAGFQALSNLSLNAMVLLIISHGGYLLSSNQITPGSLMSFLVATQTIQRSLGIVSILFGQVVKGTTAGARVFEYTKLVGSIPVHGGTVLSRSEVKGQVEFRNINFSYPSRPDQVVLDDFSLLLPAGQTTAVCGASGAGKSTLAALLERFYDPLAGGVYIDNRDITTLDPSWMRGNVIGYINQEPILFATSVMENIRYGRLSATDEEVFAAAKTANAEGFINTFPNGYETVVGERGVALSGGQKQRIAIARALLKEPKILILDEATSALDTQSEKLVQEALDKVSKGRTVLVIAHRLSTILNADNIAVINKGKVEELGKHDHLMQRKGLYYQLVKRQATAAQ